MQRVTSSIAILLLALLVSGWSNALAAALCPKMQALSCCPVKMKHDAILAHQAMASMRMDGAGAMPAAADVEALSIGQPSASCTLCFNHPDPAIRSVVIANTAQASKRNLSGDGLLARTPESLTASASPFVSIVSSRQHAPPGASTARHVLVNVFLI